MGADRRLVIALAVAATLGCGGGARSSGARPPAATAARDDPPVGWPLQACANALYPERVGVWQDTRGERNVVYDGCSVRLMDTLERDPAIFAGRRNVAHAFNVEVRPYGDPYPYFRTRARWNGRALESISILGRQYVATWAEGRFWEEQPWRPLFRVSRASELSSVARRMLGARAFVPTEEELAAECGVPMPHPTPCRRGPTSSA